MNSKFEKHALDEAISKCWCSTSKKRFGIVLISEAAESWIVKHSFLCSAHYVDSTPKITGEICQIEISDEYNGCKHCGNNALIQCSECREYSCYNTGGLLPIKTTRCGNCGTQGVVSGFAKSMNISSD